VQCKYGDVWLTGTPWQEDCGLLVPRGRASVQVEDLVRAGTPFVAGRGNKVVSLEVPVVMLHADWMLALRYCHEVFWNLPDDGALVFTEQKETELYTITYALAALESSEPQREGEIAVKVVHRFIVTGPPTFDYVGDAELRIQTEEGQNIITES
jgi:hypothetical protein